MADEKKSWFSTGWQGAKEEAQKSPFENKGPSRMWLVPENTKRVIFLDDDPISIWEHSFKVNGQWGNFEPCRIKQRNLGDERCPICESSDKLYAALTCFFTVINMTPWRTKKDDREVCFTRQVFACKMGSADKPGIAKKLDRLREANGGLRGLVFDVYRSGKKTESCGDEFTLVEKIPPADIEAYGRKQLADYVARTNAKLPAKDHTTVDKVFTKNPWRGINFEKLYETEWKPRSLAELDRLFSSGKAGGNNSGDDAGGGAAGDSTSDDIPY